MYGSIVFDYRSFEKSELRKFMHSFFCYQWEKQLEVENTKILIKETVKKTAVILLHVKAENKNVRKSY